ncbi:hypothetical protein TL16_g12047 [Triparma laevis f. inornata]|uniref:HNH nuclease domain-containing protein n=1 Tax=Triparma laevis f. inornata TaxID=1714386 RepID=A0A9W7BNY6_9STRA|nr:hypothetical protein TL16_g12047 [Triparma laevis f. inornata]
MLAFARELLTALHDYIPEATQKSPAFTRRNIFLRDDYKCQYCSSKFAPRDLTLDHVVPRCEGGRLEWKNAVSCCRVCNGRKGCKSLKVRKRYHEYVRRAERAVSVCVRIFVEQEDVTRRFAPPLAALR